VSGRRAFRNEMCAALDASKGRMSLNPESSLAELMAAPVHAGRVVWIGVRTGRRAPVNMLEHVAAITGKGLAGDRYRTPNGKRQVTLVSAEHLQAVALQAVATFLGRDSMDAVLLRRNLVVRGINLLALKDKQFRVGNAVLEYSGECHPCSRMEENLGVGGYNAMRGHGGITARIISGGEIRVGDRVEAL
jgi:MOSC domain-containing protein YiiM